MSESQEAILVVGMIGIGVRDGQRVAEDGACLLERDTMLGEVS